ncbi:hypothetical protein [Microvirga pudoricolor]|uniref:hypothetical protein n=1 Tax=Microvirga pudoricolor TaxID=2778729 RepID=UPI00195284E1|nr:hypothetical protein [Microvirga pudoricolor]MBM6594272.1 hypothetical protein [Microvirga pudoricolor]
MARQVNRGEIGTLESFSVGLLDDRDVMAVISFARSIEDFICGEWRHEGISMSAHQARALAQALLLAAQTADMGPTPTAVCS